MLEKHFGDKHVAIEGAHAEEVLRHLEHHLSQEERHELFHEAHRDGNAHFQVRAPSGDYKHFTLIHKDGKYSVES